MGSRRWCRRRAGKQQRLDGGAGVVCVVPMYLEQDIAADTVRFWHRLLARTDVEVAEVLLVTTTKEQPASGPSTRDLVETELAALGDHGGRLRLVHCEQATRFRASQLDLAVADARQRHTAADTALWVGVYNADSRPQPATFTELAYRLRAEPEVRVFQQLVDYVVPQRATTSPVAVGNAVLQTWWTHSHYWARNRRGARSRGWWAACAPYSTFGHGEFVRVDFLEEIGGFPDFAYADGLLLGWVARLRGEPIGLLAARDVAEVPRTGRDLVTQQTAWLRGLLNFDATVVWCLQNGLVKLTVAQVAALRTKHLAIPVAWGLSTAAVTAAVALTAGRIIAGSASRVDALAGAALLVQPLLPALVPIVGEHRRHRLGERLAGVALSWPLEGLALWPALASRIRRAPQAPAKTPR